MMRSPYQTPKDPPAQRFLRLPPRPSGRRRKVIAIGASLLLGFLAYSIVGTDTGLIRIRSLEHETRDLARRKADLEARAIQADRSRKKFARDPLVDERVARERFHMVKKDEIIYRYDAGEDSAR
jgi:cell division protein FtsB